MKKYIPNALTLLNLFCGSVAVIFAVNNHFVEAALFVFLGIFFDFFDGFAARKLKVQSDLGIQLDSLADMVTSGVVPGIIMYKLLETTMAISDTSGSWETSHNGEDGLTSGFGLPLLPLIGLCITLASAYRLAKFNIDEDQQTYFKGLPTPANTLLIVSLPLILEYQNTDLLNTIILNKWFLISLTLLSCYLLNSSVKLFALKFKNFAFKENAIRYIFILLCVVLLMGLQFVAIPLIILLYIGLSAMDNRTAKLNRN